MCGGPLKCGGPCSAEHVRTLVNPALDAGGYRARHREVAGSTSRHHETTLSHTHTRVYNLVQAKVRWRTVVWKLTAR